MNSYLAVNKSCNGQVPGSVSGHAKPNKRPNTVIVKRRYEHRSRTACPEYICPCPLVQSVIYVIYITVSIFINTKIKKKDYS